MSTTPKTNIEFWEKKFARNVERDRENYKKLQDLGWKICLVWECELRRPDDAIERVVAFLEEG